MGVGLNVVVQAGSIARWLQRLQIMTQRTEEMRMILLIVRRVIIILALRPEGGEDEATSTSL
jgi:hypothetical protein